MLRIIALLAVLTALPVQAAEQPYAGQQERIIKALSQQNISDLRQGKGMGFAKAAELNGYPGPRHVLDMADEIKLTGEQRENMQELFEGMQAEAQLLGADILALEAELDRLFAGGRANAGTVASLTQDIGVLRGRLRAVHLNTHLESLPLLTRHQVMLYNRLRGYDDGGKHGGHSNH